MKILNWFKTEPKTTKELQAELKAVVMRLKVDPNGYSHMNRYEKLLREIYKRGEVPEKILK